MNQELGAILAKYHAYYPEEKNRHQVLMRQLEADDMTTRKNFTGHLTANALILNPQKTHIFLIYHNTLKRRLTPGGHFERGDSSMVDNARREGMEESGFTNLKLHPWHETQGIPLDIDSHTIPENSKKNEPEHMHHDFRYVFMLENDENVELQIEEVSDGSWVALDEPHADADIEYIFKKIRRMV